MRDFIVVSDAFWSDPYWVSRHFISRELARLGRVLFVERASTWISPLFYPIGWRSVLSTGIVGRAGNLEVYRPRPRMPFDKRYRWLGAFNQRALARELNTVIRSQGFENAHLISFDHKSHVLFEQIAVDGARAYYVVDDVSEFRWPLASRAAVIADEVDTVRGADLVIATSPVLARKMGAWARRVDLLPHGVNVEAFAVPPTIDCDWLSPIPRPRAVFLGKLEPWVDIGLIVESARALPGVNFVIVGPIGIDISALKDRPNVHLIGPRPQSEVPAFLPRMDVGMIPFRTSELTRAVNPLKLYEYLAAGLPVVSTPMEVVREDAENGVFLANGAASFVAALSAALAPDCASAPARARRTCTIRAHSWSARAEQLATTLDSALLGSC